MALGFTRLHHSSRYENREVVTSDILVQVLIVIIFRIVVPFPEFDLVNSCSVVLDEFLLD